MSHVNLFSSFGVIRGREEPLGSMDVPGWTVNPALPDHLVSGYSSSLCISLSVTQTPTHTCECEHK